jgi:hypothetical protein
MMNLFLLLFTKEEFQALTHRRLVSRRLQEGMAFEHLRPRWVDTRHRLDLEWMSLGVELVLLNVDEQSLEGELRLRAPVVK